MTKSEIDRSDPFRGTEVPADKFAAVSANPEGVISNLLNDAAEKGRRVSAPTPELDMPADGDVEGWGRYLNRRFDESGQPQEHEAEQAEKPSRVRRLLTALAEGATAYGMGLTAYGMGLEDVAKDPDHNKPLT
jgi:hypothetical protein